MILKFSQIVFVALVALTQTNCAGTQTIRTSSNTMIVQASAAPACGAHGAARVAQTAAAVETIKAGFDRYIILGSQAENNVSVTQSPGSYQTRGTLVYGGGSGVYQGTSTYQPGNTIISGSRDQSFAIQMFKDGEPHASMAISARDALGPDWKDKVEKRVITCL